MANDHADLKTKIDEEPLNAPRTDQQVLDWLNEQETGPWLDVSHTDYVDWAARHKLPGKLHFVARNETYDNARTDPPSAADAERSACDMLYRYLQGSGIASRIPLSRTDVRNHLADAVGSSRVVKPAMRDDLLGIARPPVQRWENADWNIQPSLRDVEVARSL